MNTRIKVGIFIFNEVEVLDFAGPFEVFSLASKEGKKLFEVIIIGETGESISTRNGLNVKPKLKFSDNPDFDILVIPGGFGAEEIEIYNETVINWIKSQYPKVKILASVCTGALLLAEAGLLNGKKATTHWMDLNRLEKYPEIDVIKGTKFIDQGNIITSGGISAGIDMSLHIIKRLFSTEIAINTAKRMEYDYNNAV